MGKGHPALASTWKHYPDDGNCPVQYKPAYSGVSAAFCDKLPMLSQPWVKARR